MSAESVKHAKPAEGDPRSRIFNFLTKALPNQRPPNLHPPENQSRPYHQDVAPLLQLPNEVLDAICQHVEVKSIISLRLMCRRLADLGAPYMFRDGCFTLRPHKLDMYRLARVALVPSIAIGIKRLEIYMGDIDWSKFSNWIERTLPESFLGTKPFATKAFLSYEDVHCNGELLENVLTQFPNMREIDADSYRSPFQLSVFSKRPSDLTIDALILLDQAWADFVDGDSNYHWGTVVDLHKSITRYTNIILSTSRLQKPLQYLRLEYFPIDTFASTSRHIGSLSNQEEIKVNNLVLRKLTQAVSEVRGLDIGCYGAGKPGATYTGLKFGHAIGSFIGSMSNLRSLSLDWKLAEDADLSFYRGFGKGFYSKHFQHLQDLRLVNLESPRDIVSTFILQHAATLKRLSWTTDLDALDEEDELGVAADSITSWREIFTEFRERLNLECCEVLVEGNEAELLYGPRWFVRPIPMEAKVTPAKVLELFILRKMPWPMKQDNPHVWKGWRIKHPTRYKEFCQYTPKELEDLFDEDWETDREGHSSSPQSSDDDSEDHDSMNDEEMDIEDDEMYGGYSDFENEWEDYNGFMDPLDGMFTANYVANDDF